MAQTCVDVVNRLGGVGEEQELLGTLTDSFTLCLASLDVMQPGEGSFLILSHISRCLQSSFVFAAPREAEGGGGMARGEHALAPIVCTGRRWRVRGSEGGLVWRPPKQLHCSPAAQSPIHWSESNLPTLHLT